MAPDDLSTEYLYDFLYIDRERISWYFSQLSPHGRLDGITAREDSQKIDELSGGLTAGVAKGNLTSSEAITRAIERHYDPEWVLPLTVIETLHEQQYLAQRLEEATMGKLVLLRGRLEVVDIRLLQQLWDPIMRLLQGKNEPEPLPPGATRTARKQHEKATAQERQRRDGELGSILDVIKELPHAVQMSFETDDGTAWATLDPKNMTAPPGDLALKHGYQVDGEWNLLGVLDARPDLENLQSRFPPASDVRQAMQSLCILIRNILGRPGAAYGVTPVMLFRAVKPHGN